MTNRRINELFALFFDPRVPATFVLSAIVLAVLGNAVYDLLVRLVGDTPQALGAIAAVALLLFVGMTLAAWAWLRARRPRVATGVPIDQQAVPHASLIVFVSEGQQKAAQAAIEFHRGGGQLRACWLLATPEVQAKAGELASAARQTGLAVAILPISSAFDSRAAYGAVNTALEQARRAAATQPAIVDITGGTKPMTAGAVLACFEQSAPMQYMRTVFVNGQAIVDAQPQAMRVEPLD